MSIGISWGGWRWLSTLLAVFFWTIAFCFMIDGEPPSKYTMLMVVAGIESVLAIWKWYEWKKTRIGSSDIPGEQ